MSIKALMDMDDHIRDLLNRIEQHHKTYDGTNAQWITWGPVDPTHADKLCFGGCGKQPLHMARLIAGSTIVIAPTCDNRRCMEAATLYCIAMYASQHAEHPLNLHSERNLLHYDYTPADAAQALAEDPEMHPLNAITILMHAYDLNPYEALTLYEPYYYAQGRTEHQTHRTGA